MTIRVLIADDQAVVRSGFASLLGTQADIDVVAEAADGAQAVDLAERHRPDIALLDIRMPAMDGIEATRRILGDGNGTTKVLILTTFDLDEYVYAALGAGASGFLLKDTTFPDLLDAIRVIVDGAALLSPTVTKRLITEFARQRRTVSPTTGLPGLTDREAEVLRLIARGLSNTDIADHLKLTANTVKSHVNRLFRKLNVHDRAQAVILAYENGLVVPRSSPTT